MRPNLTLLSPFLRPGEVGIRLLGVATPISAPGPPAEAQRWRAEGWCRAVAMRPDSGRVCYCRSGFPPGLGCAAGADGRWQRTRFLGRANSAPVGSREAKQGRRAGDKCDSGTEKGARVLAAGPRRLALPRILPNSRNPKIPKIPKAKLQAGLQKFGNGLPGFPASSPHS